MHTRATLVRPAWSVRVSRSLHAGFTLIEVLVAIMILSFGMLGAVGLQAAAMQANKEARNQSSAVRLGREYAEMMRANPEIASRPTNNPYVVPPVQTSVNCFTGACATPLEVAQYEVWEWYERASKELPDLRIVACFDTAPYDSGGMPQWACSTPSTVVPGQPVFVKIGWTKQTTNRSADGGAGSPLVVRATDTGSRPLVIVPAQMNRTVN